MGTLTTCPDRFRCSNELQKGRRTDMTSTAFVRARIDEQVKDEASEVLAEFGLTVSDIVRMTLTSGTVPLELKVPNAANRAAIRESRRLMKKHNARFRNAGAVFKALDENARERQAR